MLTSKGLLGIIFLFRIVALNKICTMPKSKHFFFLLSQNAESVTSARPLIDSEGHAQIPKCRFPCKVKQCFSGCVSDRKMYLIIFSTTDTLNNPKALYSSPGWFSPALYFLSLFALSCHAWRSCEMWASTYLTDYCNSYTLISCTNH